MQNRKRLKEAVILKSFKTSFGLEFDNNNNTKIILDKKNSYPKKEHGIIYQQHNQWGTVGDKCDYISHNQLLELEKQGVVKIIYHEGVGQ